MVGEERLEGWCGCKSGLGGGRMWMWCEIVEEEAKKEVVDVMAQ